MRGWASSSCLARVRERLPGPPGRGSRLGSGDDAAVTVPGGATATSVDALVEGVHFEPRARRALRQIGAKALATALSDLAAMGAEPGEAYVVLGVPADLDEDGLPRARRRDRSSSPRRPGRPSPAATSPAAPALSFAITVVGHASGAGPLRPPRRRPPRRRPGRHRRARRRRRRAAAARARAAELGLPAPVADGAARPPARAAAAAGRRPRPGGGGARRR